MRQYEMVIWDVDGTLLDTREGIIRSVKYCMGVFNKPYLPQHVLEEFIGPPIQESFEKKCHVSKKEAEKMAEIFRNRYKSKDLFYATPYKDIEFVLKSISDNSIKQAVATYKREDYAKSIIEHFGLQKYLLIIHGSDTFGRLKKKDIIRKCLVDGGILNSKKAVMIGDSTIDAQGAEELGIDFIGVTYGFGFKENLLNKDIKNIGWANTPREILKVLRRS